MKSINHTLRYPAYSLSLLWGRNWSPKFKEKLTCYQRILLQLNSNMSFDMKYGRCLFICQLLINLSLWNQISMVYFIILQCCYILKFLPVLISVYIFSVFLFWYFDFSNRGQGNVLTSLSFDDIRCCLSKTKQETNKHALLCIM